jgi:hypothetical protein
MSDGLWKRAGFAAALALAVLVLQAGQGAAEPPRHLDNISVTTYFSDTDSGGSPSCIRSDGLGAYHDGVDGVMSILTSNGYGGIAWGDWQFQTFSSDRNVGHSFDMANAVLPGDSHYTAPATPPYLDVQYLPSRVQVKCTLIGNDMLTMDAGSSFSCPLHNNLTWTDGVVYSFDPANSWTHYAETTDVLVTCNTADPDGCNDWFIDPIPTTPPELPGAVGRLTKPWTGKGKQQPDVNLGDFYMKFHIHITRP